MSEPGIETVSGPFKAVIGGFIPPRHGVAIFVRLEKVCELLKRSAQPRKAPPSVILSGDDRCQRKAVVGHGSPGGRVPSPEPQEIDVKLPFCPAFRSARFGGCKVQVIAAR